jgi:VanZ family protein
VAAYRRVGESLQPSGPRLWARRAWIWGPPLVAAAAIFVASSVESLPSTPGDLSDSTLHGIAFGTLAALLLRALAGGRWRGVTPAAALAAAGLAMVYGAVDEWHQSFVPGRTPEARDLLADSAGAWIAVLVIWTWSIIRRPRSART